MVSEATGATEAYIKQKRVSIKLLTLSFCTHNELTNIKINNVLDIEQVYSTTIRSTKKAP